MKDGKNVREHFHGFGNGLGPRKNIQQACKNPHWNDDLQFFSDHYQLSRQEMFIQQNKIIWDE